MQHVLSFSWATNWSQCRQYVGFREPPKKPARAGSDASECADPAGCMWAGAWAACQKTCAVCRPCGRSSESSSRVCSRTVEQNFHPEAAQTLQPHAP